ncbi:MAG: WD40 repeat domain-containing protein [Symploca sp. SIO1C2]|nr:WD40 repeat domain-containing protein [Symploca sp. SIO1C2]
MAAVTSKINQERALRVAVKRIEGFTKQFGKGHRNLALHAAFPLALTPDLLYQIWANFVPEAPWTAVAHVLLSRLCREVGYEMYEMEISDRNLLLRELKKEFGQQRLDELAEFLLDYVAQRLTGDDSDIRDLREAQEWTALAYTKPSELARELAEALSERVKREDMGEVLRLTSLAETFAEPLVEAGFEPLLIYADGMASFVRGDLKGATAKLRNLPQRRRLVQIGNIDLPIPDLPIPKSNQNSIQQLLPILRPFLRNESERRAYLMRALGTNADALNLIWNEPINIFIPNMVNTLVAFGELTPGKPALCALLEVIRQDVGEDVKVKIDKLLQQIREELNPRDNQVPPGYRKAVAQYFYVTLQRLKEQGCLNIRKDVVNADRRLNYVAQITDFELPFAVMNMRGDAFFMFSEFSAINMKTLRQFSAQCMNLARQQVTPSAVGKALYNFRMPTHFCFAIALVDRVEQKTATKVQTTNPLDHTTDVLWYEIPIIYELSQQKLYFYDNPSSFWENFKGEVAWRNVRAVIQQVLSGKPLKKLEADKASLEEELKDSEVTKDQLEKLEDENEASKTSSPTTTSAIRLSSETTFQGHSELVHSVAISPNGQILASGSVDQTIKLWNLATGKLLYALEGHSSAVLSVAFHPDGKTLASASNLAVGNGNLKLWDVKTGTLQQVFDQGLLNFRVSCVTFSPNGQTLATGNIDATIKLWKLSNGKLYRTLKGHGWDVTSVAFSRNGKLLVSGGLDGGIKIWNWCTGELLHALNQPSPSNIIGSLVSWFDSSVGAIYSVAISPDGQMIASAGSEQPIILWNSETGKLVRTLTEHSGSVFAVAFSPKGKCLASGGKDNTVRIWNYQTGELLQTLEHLSPVHCLAFSPNGQTLVSGSADATIKVWSV